MLFFATAGRCVEFTTGTLIKRTIRRARRHLTRRCGMMPYRCAVESAQA
jgi:hypothetical protein